MKANVKEIIDYYKKAEDKKEAIEKLAEIKDLSVQRIYQILKENNVPPPTKAKKKRILQTKQDNKPEIQFPLNYMDVSSNSIINKFKDLGWLEKENTQRVINIFNYIENEYGIDVQDKERYELALKYFDDIIKTAQKFISSIEITIFLHKYDPDIEEIDESIEDDISEKLIKKIKELVPSDFNYKIFTSSLFAVFEKTLVG